jgi:hypothetical protein
MNTKTKPATTANGSGHETVCEGLVDNPSLPPASRARQQRFDGGAQGRRVWPEVDHAL